MELVNWVELNVFQEIDRSTQHLDLRDANVNSITHTSSKCSFSHALRRRVRTSKMANTNDGLHIKDGNDVINLFKYPNAMSLALSILWVDHIKSTRSSLERPVGRAWRDALAFKMLTDPRMI